MENEMSGFESVNDAALTIKKARVTIRKILTRDLSLLEPADRTVHKWIDLLGNLPELKITRVILLESEIMKSAAEVFINYRSEFTCGELEETWTA